MFSLPISIGPKSGCRNLQRNSAELSATAFFDNKKKWPFRQPPFSIIMKNGPSGNCFSSQRNKTHTKAADSVGKLNEVGTKAVAGTANEIIRAFRQLPFPPKEIRGEKRARFWRHRNSVSVTAGCASDFQTCWGSRKTAVSSPSTYILSPKNPSHQE